MRIVRLLGQLSSQRLYLSLSIAKFVYIRLVDGLELRAVFLDALQTLLKRLDRLLALSIETGNTLELFTGLVELLTKANGISLALFLIKREHDLDARGEVRVEELPLVGVGRQEHFLINNHVLQRLQRVLIQLGFREGCFDIGTLSDILIAQPFMQCLHLPSQLALNVAGVFLKRRCTI